MHAQEQACGGSIICIIFHMTTMTMSMPGRATCATPHDRQAHEGASGTACADMAIVQRLLARLMMVVVHTLRTLVTCLPSLRVRLT
mmetsp:Transcript_4461/g.12525  ORF Transcript_4461/g.12525 Transcript_4461/m.12525 type:complete len:86 (-) Transcript_4461:724-981(-)